MFYCNSAIWWSQVSIPHPVHSLPVYTAPYICIPGLPLRCTLPFIGSITILGKILHLLLSWEKFCTCSEKLNNSERIYCFNKRFETGFGKPILPECFFDSTLTSFVGPSSWNFFNLLNIDKQFLQISIEWKKNWLSCLLAIR